MVPRVALQVFDELKKTMTITKICRLLNIPRSTYYRWRDQYPNTRKKTDLENKIGSLCKKHHYTYGYRTITGILRKEMLVNHKTIQRIMQTYGWQCRVKVKKRKVTGQPYHIVENILKQDFSATKPFEKLVTDITYLPFGQKMLYLSSIKDLYNGEIVAYTIKDRQDVNLVLDTLNQLPPFLNACTLHSDQGSVYTSYAYQAAVKEKGITMSMSRKGTPADNAPIESFHSSLKSERFYLYNLTRTTTAIVESTVHDYIDYYNNIRIQTKLNYQSPVQYRQLAV